MLLKVLGSQGQEDRRPLPAPAKGWKNMSWWQRTWCLIWMKREMSLKSFSREQLPRPGAH